MARFATRDADEALDLVQDAMLKLVQRYSHKPAGEWRGLFFRILERRIIDWHRRRQVRSAVLAWLPGNSEASALTDIEQWAADEISPERQLIAEQDVVALERALYALPLRQQQAFLLREWEGFDIRETARIMGCSSGSVKTHYSRARRVLEKSMLE